MHTREWVFAILVVFGLCIVARGPGGAAPAPRSPGFVARVLQAVGLWKMVVGQEPPPDVPEAPEQACEGNVPPPQRIYAAPPVIRSQGEDGFARIQPAEHW